MRATALRVLGAGGTVITAGHRLAEQLRSNYDLSQRDAGLRAWPAADVLPWDAWLRRAWETAVVSGAPSGDRRLLTPEEARMVWRRVMESAAGPGTDARVLVPLAASAWRLCQDFRLDLAQVRAAADTDDARAFCSWAAGYERVLRERGWIDAGGLGAALARDIGHGDLHVPPLTAFAAFDPWTPALEEMAASLSEAGGRVEQLAPGIGSGTVRVAACRDEDAEYREAAAWARRCLETNPAASVAVIVPDLERVATQVRRAFLDLLSPGWQLRPPAVPPVFLSGGRSLADYPIVHAALALLGASQGQLAFEDASYLLRCPYLPGALGEEFGRARVELELRRRFVHRLSATTLAQRARVDAPGMTHALTALLEPLLEASAAGRRMTPSLWSATFATALERCGWPGDRPLADDEVQVLAAWRRALQVYAGCDEVGGPLSFGQALAGIQDIARQRAFEPDSPMGGVAVLGVAEAAGQAFDHLWVCGLSAERWPEAPRAHALLPLGLQRAAGLPGTSAERTRAEAREQLRRFSAAAAEVVFSWPWTRDQSEALMSPLLSHLPGGRLDSPPAHPQRAGVAASAVLEMLEPDNPPPLAPGQRLQGGAGLLSMQAACPARAFIEGRLLARKLPPPPRPLDGAMRGMVVHRLLQLLYAEEAFRTGLGAVPAEALEDAFARIVGPVLDEFLPGDDGFLARLREQERHRLRSLVQFLVPVDGAREPFTVDPEVARELRIGPLLINLRLDRVDRLASGGELVIDYKTGDFKASGWRRRRPGDCQLPAYAMTGPSEGVAVFQFRPDQLRVQGVGDPSPAVEGILPPEKFFREPGLTWDQVLARWRAHLEALAFEFAAGDFRLDPRELELASGQFAGLTRIYDDPRLRGDGA